MTKTKLYQISEVAALSRVTVRTLHYYDEIGLLSPIDRTQAGYRLYDGDSLLRLQQILIHQSLGFNLEAIRRTLDDPLFDLTLSLEQQLAHLQTQADTTAAMITSVQNALVDIQSERGRTTMDYPEIFNGFDPALFEAEVETKWGNTELFAQSKARTRNYSKADWQTIKAEQEAIFKAGAALMQSGVSSNDPAVKNVIERHRLFINRWFYTCSAEFQQNLADMWEADTRFARTMDAYGEGLTDFLVQAIRAK